MEEAPVTAATGALGPVLAKLSALLRRRRGDREYQLRRSTRKDVKLVRSKLKSIHSILWGIWEREDLDAAGKELRMKAWRLADDMNDAIDDFILSMKRSNDGKRFLEDKTQQRPFQYLKKRAIDVSERCRNKWKMETSHTIVSSLFSRTKTTVDSGSAKRPRVVDPYVQKDISELVDMEKPRDKLIEHLVGEENTPRLKIACIVGAAGTGKTTLARLVYEAIEDKFQARAFVSVNSSRNMTEVLASILQQVAGIPESTSVPLAGTKEVTEKHLVDIVSNFLKDKRYLVIIDDIWHCGQWETMQMSLPDSNLGSRIVMTSCVSAITEKWHDDFDALLVHKIDHLSYSCVAKMVDMSADMIGEGFDRRHRIVGMCVGMPLAVACMISAFAKERERQEQQGLCVVRTCDVQDKLLEQVTRNGIQNTPGFEPLVESLELWYKDLPHHMLKTCLLYCSIYPEGHSFFKDDLVIRWNAEGFVCKEEAAKDYFDELVSRGLFQETQSGFMTIRAYNVQAMMRNYLRQKLREDNFITCTSDGIPSSPVGRLCIDYCPSSDAVDPLSEIDWHHIRSLVVFKDAERVPYNHLENLRVLDVGYKEDLQNEHLKDICGLLRLRHLLLEGVLGHHGGITEMPAEIESLQYLETLEVTSTNITRLPAEIGDLKQLKTLGVSWNKWITELPREMGNLQHLQTLRIRGAKIRELPREIIGTLKKLKTLDVSWNERITELPKEIGNLQHLETLNVSGTGITELPREIGNLEQLVALYLSRLRSIVKLPQHLLYRRLPIPTLKLPRDIGKLQNLETLDLSSTYVTKIPREIGGLKKLKNLNAELSTLPFEAGHLPKLDGLPQSVHEALKNSDLASSLAREILSFETTDSIRDGGLIIGAKHMHVPQWIKEHFNNIGSLDIRLCKLEEQDLNILREMPNLWNLKLRFEAVPRKPIAITGGGFARLEILTVDSRVPQITFQEGAMPSLLTLEFEFQFYGGPPNTNPVGIKHLMRLEKVTFRCNRRWYRADSPCISATIDVMMKEARKHTNNIIFEVSGQGKKFISRISEDYSDSDNAESEEHDEEIFPENYIVRYSEDRIDACSSSEGNEIEEIIQA